MTTTPPDTIIVLDALTTLTTEGGGISTQAGWCLSSEVWHRTKLPYERYHAAAETLLRQHRVTGKVVERWRGSRYWSYLHLQKLP